MFDGLISALILAWILSLFGFDHIAIKGCKELFNVVISESGYYLIFAIVGAICGILGKSV